MKNFVTRYTCYLGLIAASVGVTTSSAFGQSLRGGEIRFAAVASAEERKSQSDLWVMDVYYKPMRQIAVPLTDPKTGEKKLEYVWYIVYRGFVHKFQTKVDEDAPVNVLDEPVAPQQFIPEFQVVVSDNDKHEVFSDQVIPEALVAINKREKGKYKSAVEIVGPIPEAADAGSSEQIAVEGVAMWRGIDPDADRYTVFMTGFSNGIRKVPGPDGKQVIQTKTIMQKYLRRGDRFDQKELEIVPDGDTQWIYR